MWQGTWQWPVAGLAALLGTVGCTTPRARPPESGAADPSTIAALEARFAATSRQQGAKAAFLAFLADDSIVLQPGPVPGRAAWGASPALAGTLDWSPDGVGMAGDGSFGFATGPWRFEPKEGSSTVQGRYLTIWRRGAEGWKVLFDGGYGARGEHDGAGTAATPAVLSVDCRPGPPVPVSALQSLDRSLSGTASGVFAAHEIGRLATGAVLFHPPGVTGLRSVDSQQVALERLPAGTELRPAGGAVAASGDLGYTYGLSAPADGVPADAAFVHVWCREGGEWRLLIDLRRPLPPTTAPGDVEVSKDHGG